MPLTEIRAEVQFPEHRVDDDRGDMEADRQWRHEKKRGLTHDDILDASVRINPELRRRSELLFVVAPHGPNGRLWLGALTAPLMPTGLTACGVGQIISIIDGSARGASSTAMSLAGAGRDRTFVNAPTAPRRRQLGA
jgi:hypothetical protein